MPAPSKAKSPADLGSAVVPDPQNVPSIGAVLPKDGPVAVPDANDVTPVRVYNRGRKRYDHTVYPNDPRGFEATEYKLQGASHLTVPRWLADFWALRYPDDIVSGDEGAPGEATAELNALKVKASTLEAEKAALQAELDNMKKKLAAASE